MDTQFIGEHLVPGQLGHFFVITAFIGSLLSAFSYYRSAQTEIVNPNNSRGWLLLGRNGFVIHATAIFGIFATLFYIITNHLFEYHYAWRHSDLSLPAKYLLSCFWEGQEGSFLLWMIWHSVLGLIVMANAKVLESRVMSIIAIVQVMLATMLLGYYLGPEIKIGSNPFLLLRDQMQGAPIFSQPNYLDFIKDGNGLNVLLQNYWMVIHPPVLFLGFASTLIPFAYTIAALWKGEYQTWLKPAINWALFSGAVLGTGIMMGGAWAYESLTFGGYWAWDPVENASLVPWLTLIAGLHTLVVYKATGRSLIITVILFVLTYLLVWYSTFLTRTGVLGDTSVHAFTGEGKSLYWHLLVVIGLLIVLSVSTMIARWKGMPRVKTEENVNTREFWMFIGSFVLLLSAVQIIISTSIPVWSPLAKWITGKDVAPPVNPVAHYNSIQVWVAVIVGLMTAMVLFLKFKKSDNKVVLRRLATTGAIALAVALIIGFVQKIDAPQYAVLLFAACYTITGMIYYMIVVQKGKIKKMGPATAHLGFGLALLGILLSSYNKQVISFNTLGVIFPFGKKTQEEDAKESRENVLMYRGVPVALGEYFATYQGDSTAEGDPRTFYKVHYERRDTATNELKESFTLYPDAFINPKGQEGLSANPASKHYLTKDIFTYVTSVIDPNKRTDTNTYKAHTVKAGDTVYLNSGYMIFKGFKVGAITKNFVPQQGDLAVAADLTVLDLNGNAQNLQPVYCIRGNDVLVVEDTLKSMQLYTRLTKIIPDKDAAEIEVKQADPKDDYIVMKALVFPYINVLWLGVLVMVMGFFISIWNRLTKKEKILKEQPPIK
ncbi:MAG: cytochrome c assembly protein [Sphingobacteriales bacterium]|nr:MAG: cytochrome c assembly protein [Sphingobacteriales bacterium]